MQPVADILWQCHQIGMAEELDSLARRVHHHATVVTVLQMTFEFRSNGWIQIAV